MKNITSYLYSFEKLIDGNFLYVDKTEYIWKMLRPSAAGYFLARPRRFGKSLTVSTLKAIFEGKRNLFEGLAISKKDYDWEVHPVIHLSFADLTASANSPEGVKDYLFSKVNQQAVQFDIPLTEKEPGLRLGQLIDELAKQNTVAVLVDEYDKPLIDNINSPQVEEIRNELKCFFGVLKDRNSSLRMLFVTGVTKFSHVSLFSGVNNLTDISMSRDYACMLGYTQSEFESAFDAYIDAACAENGKSRAEMLAEIKEWYNGFRFEEKAETVYNPVSLAKFFENNSKFLNYWFATGTPTFLMKLAKEKNFNIEKTIREPVLPLSFDAFEIDNIDPLALLLQTGYLTIRKAEFEYGETVYYLDFPNREVKSSFETYLINSYTGVSKDVIGITVLKLHKAIKSGDMELFMELLKTFYAGFAYDVGANVEGRYQIIFAAVFTLIGIRVEAESRSSNGRSDAVIIDGDNIYIFEFKINQSAAKAISQIREKEYYLKYGHSGKNITLIGANFDTESRQLTGWKIENA